VNERVERFFTALLLTAAILFTLGGLQSPKSGESPEDPDARQRAQMEKRPHVALAYALWERAGLTAFAGVLLVLAARARRGVKLTDPLSEPPPWGVGDFTLVFVGNLALQMTAALATQGSSPLGEVAGIAASAMAAPVLVFAWVRFRCASGSSAYRELGLVGFSIKEVARGAVGSLALVPAALAFQFASAWLCRSLSVPLVEHPLLVKLEKNPDPLTFLVLLVLVSVIAPFSEEILFRGCLLRALRRTIPSRAGALLASAFFFGAFHGFSNLLPIGWVGFVFGFLFLTSTRRSLLGSMVCHGLFNGTQIALKYALFAH
jgi:membrane protease YdiL (CAAX protease family)